METAKIPLAKIIRNIIILLGILLLVSLLGMIKYPWQQSFRVVFSSFYVLFLPGFIWSYVFFDKRISRRRDGKNKKPEDKKVKDKPLDAVERILISFALSIALGPLALFFLNKVGVKINLGSSFFVILGLMALGLGIIFYQRKFYKQAK
ncbi:DUF1616 domain-containing protein [Patescibacteria group bacterium]|nr:DUF1616 domain-containing protein [Patescibacteria group bacterium]